MLNKDVITINTSTSEQTDLFKSVSTTKVMRMCWPSLTNKYKPGLHPRKTSRRQVKYDINNRTFPHKIKYYQQQHVSASRHNLHYVYIQQQVEMNP